MPRLSPSSQCGLGAKSKAGCCPQRITSTFSASLFPGGTLSWVRLGMATKTARMASSAWAALAPALPFPASAPGSGPSPLSAGCSAPALRLRATSWLSWLRCAWRISAWVMRARRSWSSSRKLPSRAAGSMPRARSFSSTSSRLARTKFKSSISLYFTGASLVAEKHSPSPGEQPFETAETTRY